MDSADSTQPTTSGLVVGTAEQYRWLHGIVKTVLILNLLDALFTLLWVRWGVAREANLLVESLVNEHAIGFVLVKTALVGMGSWLLWEKRQYPAAVIAIFIAFLAYYWVVLYHLQYAGHVVRQLWG
ncbi:MAG: DUF5658 family protein [Myxococcota bacterium]